MHGGLHFAACGLLLAALCPSGAWGQTVSNWRTPEGGAYAVANNWDNGNVPDAADESARFALDAAYTVLFASNSRTTIMDLLVEDGGVNFGVSGITGNSVLRTGDDTIISGARLTLAKPNNSFFTLTLEVDDLLRLDNKGILQILDGSDVNVFDLFVAPVNGHQGAEVTVSGSGSTLTAMNAFDVGFSGEGTMTVSDGAEATSVLALIGDQLQSDGEVVVTGDGSTWNNGFTMRIGREGRGLLSIENGGMVASSNDTTLGVEETGMGTIIVTGDKSLLDVDGVLTIGNRGTGTLRVEAGGAVISSESEIAALIGPGDAVGTGAVTVTGENSSWSSGTLRVGKLGVGTMRIEDRGNVTSEFVRIGNASDGDGTVIVTDAGSMWTTEELSVGGLGSGILLVESGGHVTSASAVISDASVSLGDVSVTGSGSNWDLVGKLTIGAAGQGTLTVADGASTFSQSGVLGESTSSIGAVTVDGAGSQWAVGATLEVGNQGAGNLVLQDGGAVQSGSTTIGVGRNGAGEVTVAGMNSMLKSTEQVIVGLTGAGILNVNDGGTVTAGETLDIGAAGAVNLAGGTIVADDVVFNGSTFHFIGGTLHLRNDQTLTFSRASDLGLHELGVAKAFIVDGNLALQTPMVLDGGTLTAGSISGGTNLRLRPDATLNLSNQTITVGSGETLGATLDLPNGATVNVAQGMVNRGLITGDGAIGGPLTNDPRGQIHVSAGDTLTFTGQGFLNRGRVNLLGGVLKLEQPATNAADALIAGNGSLVTAGLSNSGTIALSGITHVLGDVTNRRGATILSTGGGPTTFHDDVTNDGDVRTSLGGFTVFLGTVDGTGNFPGQGTVNFEGDLTPGASPAIITFDGNVEVGTTSSLHIELAGVMDGEFDRLAIGAAATLGGDLRIDLIDMFAPTARDTFTILSAASRAGQFINVADGQRLATIGGEGSFLVSYDGVSNSVLLSEFLRTLLGLPGDTDDDGDVDIDDLNNVRNNFGAMGPDNGTLSGDAFPFDGMVDIDDLNGVRNNFGAVAAALPEPATLTLLLLSSAVVMPRSRSNRMCQDRFRTR